MIQLRYSDLLCIFGIIALLAFAAPDLAIWMKGAGL